MDYEREARELVQNLSGRLSPSPYDIAWLARLKTSPKGEARWPDLMEWLLNNQYEDGHWGSDVAYYHHQIINTLSAVIALQKNGRDYRSQSAIKRAENYLWNHLHFLRRDPFELVGFELLFPTLLKDAQLLGLDVPSHAFGYNEIQSEKLRLIPPDLLYSPHVATVFSLEFLGASGNAKQLREAVSSNGSLGNSPATTAYYLSICPDDERALAYLNSVRQRYSQAANFYPFRTFELTWVLYYLAHCGSPITKFVESSIWLELQSNITASGISFDPTFCIPDGDTTSVGARLLLEAGYDFNPVILSKFQDPATLLFRTWNYERNTSMGTNMHAFEALNLMPNYPNYSESREAILAALLANRVYDLYWVDKWHASPYYATAHALMILLKENRYLTQPCLYTVNWLLHMQRADGSWGFFEEGTAEETAYALLSLLHWHRSHKLPDPDCLHRAAHYLERMYSEPDTFYPGLYIAKVLFAPYAVVRAAMLSALILYEETFG